MSTESLSSTVDQAVNSMAAAGRRIDQLIDRVNTLTAERDALVALMDVADGKLDDDIYDQSLKDGFDAPDDAEYTVRFGTICAINRVFSAIEKMRRAATKGAAS